MRQGASEVLVHSGIYPSVLPFTIERAYERYALLTASDAHELEDVGAAATRLLAESASLGELRLAMQGRQGRRIVESPEQEGGG